MNGNVQAAFIAALIGTIGTAMIGIPPALAAPVKCVAYFYNEAESAAPITATIVGKSTIKVPPVAPGALSAPVSLPDEKSSDMPPQVLAQLKSMGMAAPNTPLAITVHARGGDTKVGLVSNLSRIEKTNTRAYIYVAHVKSANAAPDDIPGAAVSVFQLNYDDAKKGKAPIAIVDEIPDGSDSVGGEVFYRLPSGYLKDGGGPSGAQATIGAEPTLVVKPGDYDIVRHSKALDGLITAKIANAQPAVARVTKADFHPGHIAIYIVPKPGKLEHVTDLPAN